MNAIGWKLNRLRLMAPAELAWRFRQAAQQRWEQLYCPKPPAPIAIGGAGGWTDCPPPKVDAAAILTGADRLLGGTFELFAMRDAVLGFPPEWNRDPQTGVRAPLGFGKRLNYRDQRLVGNIKYLWELNRHCELVTLAQAYRLSGERRYLEGCGRLLESWFAQCPYPRGQAWASALENAIRLVNWAVAWALLDVGNAPFPGWPGKVLKRRWLDSIYLHCRFIAGHLSLYSSANNHLFGEYMGLFIAALSWPCWPESAGWRETARRGLEEEAIKQNAPDGVNREQGIWYHHEVADMMLLAGLFARRAGADFSVEYWTRLERMLEFVVALMDAGGNMPMIGDSDDAVMVRFSPQREFDVFRSLLASGAVVFGRADFARKAGRFDDKSRWLLGAAGERAFTELALSDAECLPVREFPQGGYYILGQDFDTPQEVRVVADAGPLGYLSIAAHGHADALAFTLSAGGTPLLIDPGTYAYHTEPRWRSYFRGTGAHNTVRVDGRDQSRPGGNFMWLKKAQARCEHWSVGADEDLLHASHDGYLDLPDPVRHRRVLAWKKRERSLIVDDTIECLREHGIEHFWHFAPDCEVSSDGRRVLARSGATALEMAMPGSSARPEIFSGVEDPPIGWISYCFDEKQPCTTVVWRERISGEQTRQTLIRVITGRSN